MTEAAEEKSMWTLSCVTIDRVVHYMQFCHITVYEDIIEGSIYIMTYH